MRRYVIEREIPNIGSLNEDELQEAAAKSNFVLRQLAPDIQWLESFIADNKMFCIYLAKDDSIIQQHARVSGFPATKITEVGRVIGPETGADPHRQISREACER